MVHVGHKNLCSDRWHTRTASRQMQELLHFTPSNLQASGQLQRMLLNDMLDHCHAVSGSGKRGEIKVGGC